MGENPDVAGSKKPTLSGSPGKDREDQRRKWERSGFFA
ncbi:hypothetical protein LptCag_2018 [Leptospirillum ferriphilum]|uniref:Uncharacterized protein n=1 Tax=Leptospirillum ferriphilum TaxID=178606 RepID=A0A094WAM5_9BACT|nr:hypothetical protein LptCag_2018 [Leptospirillum ferriphilum]